MQLLEAINRVISSAGQEPVQDLSSTSMERGKAEDAINRARKEILANGYQFNTDVLDLQPDPAEANKVAYPEGFLFVGLGSRPFKHNRGTSDVRNLSYRYTANSSNKQQAFIWNLRDLFFVTDTVTSAIRVFDVFDNTVEGRNFTRIPELLASWISQEAAAQYFHTVNAGPSADLLRRVEKAKTKFINREKMGDIHTVTGFRTIEAIGQGGTTSTFDVRSQATLL